jgi:4-aminobutyrate aminotransferase/(S)-3-amino-2-methylpropionate transaminase
MLVPDKAYRQFNAWIGDPARVIMGKAVIQENPSKNLVEQCVSTYDDVGYMDIRYPAELIHFLLVPRR